MYSSMEGKLSGSSDNANHHFNSNQGIKVCVRIRPFHSNELQLNSANIIDVTDLNTFVFDPESDHKQIGNKPNKNLKFVFDRVFDEKENNRTVYLEITKSLVSSLLAGINCSVFTYGATGSGKTHTMFGTSAEDGIIFYATKELYEYLEMDENRNVDLLISYFEIYNEAIYDLFNPTSGKRLTVQGSTVTNLTTYQPKNFDQLKKLLEEGSINRKQRSTDFNSHSSRSHAIIQIQIRRFALSEYVKMTFIDLAGSEKASVTVVKANRNKQIEGSNINKSLLALGNCINALSNKKKTCGRGFIPYRDSKLTMLLRDSFNGQCKTIMIATVSPSASHYSETYNTLLYAERAKGIQWNVQSKNCTNSRLQNCFKLENDWLKLENDNLSRANQSLRNEISKYKTLTVEMTAKSNPKEMLETAKSPVDHLFEQRNYLRSKLLDYEHQLQLIELRSMFVKFNNDEISGLNAQNNSAELKLSYGANASLYNQKSHLADLRANFIEKVKENEAEITRIENYLLERTNNDPLVKCYFSENERIVQTKDIDFERKHCDDVISIVFTKLESNKQLISASYKFIYSIKAQGILSAEMESEYIDIIHKMEGKKSVVWRDSIESPKMRNMAKLMKLSRLHGTSIPVTPIKRRTLVSVRQLSPITPVSKPITRSKSHGPRNVAIVTPVRKTLQATPSKHGRLQVVNTLSDQTFVNSNQMVDFFSTPQSVSTFGYNLRSKSNK